MLWTRSWAIWVTFWVHCALAVGHKILEVRWDLAILLAGFRATDLVATISWWWGEETSSRRRLLGDWWRLPNGPKVASWPAQSATVAVWPKPSLKSDIKNASFESLVTPVDSNCLTNASSKVSEAAKSPICFSGSSNTGAVCFHSFKTQILAFCSQILLLRGWHSKIESEEPSTQCSCMVETWDGHFFDRRAHFSVSHPSISLWKKVLLKSESAFE